MTDQEPLDVARHEHAHSHHDAAELGEAALDAAVTENRIGPQGGGLDSIISLGAFMLGNKVSGLTLAIVLATGWSLVAAARRRRKGLPIGKLLPITAGYLAVRGIIGIVTGSKDVYFGIGIGTKAAIGLGLLGSVLIGRAVFTRYAHLLLPFPEWVRSHAKYHSTFARLTVIGGVFEIVSAGTDLWLYRNSSTNGFLLLRFGLNWLLGFGAIFGAIIYADVALKKIPGFDGLLALAEAASSRDKPAAR